MRLLLPALCLSLWAGGPPTALELAKPRMQTLGEDVWVAPLAPGVWVTSFTADLEPGVVYPANGLLIEVPGGSVLVDPGWRAAQARVLLRWSERTLHRPVRKAVVTHSHADRSAGIATLREAGVPVLASVGTAARLASTGKPLPDQALALRAPYRDRLGFELLFPGPGHAPDNIVVWVPRARVLFGGCFLKSATAEGLGNLEDADARAWPASLAALRRAYPHPRVQVPGHGTVAGDAFARTEALLRVR